MHKPMRVSILIANPDTEIVHVADGIWIIAALNVQEMKRHIEANKFKCSEKLLEELINLAEETTIIKINIRQNNVDSIYAYKNITSKFELFYLTASDGSLVITDHFRNALACLKPEDRKVTLDQIADHLLFPSMPGNQTHVANIFRLGQGESIEFNMHTGKSVQKIEEKITESKDQIPIEEALEKVDHTLKRLIDGLKEKEGLATLLSGGIDSTLVHTYLGSTVASLGVVVDSPEFSEEVRYARRASALLKNNHNFLFIKENDYLEHLKSDIRTLALPSQVTQLVLFGVAARSVEHNFKTLLTGDFVAPLFGSAETDLQKSIRAKAKGLLAYAEALMITSDQLYVRKLIGNKKVEERLHNRTTFVLNRADILPAGDGELPADLYLELKAVFALLFNNATSLWRQLAYGYGRTVHTPFTGKSLLDVSLSIPRQYRYEKEGRAKHILKDLLKQRLPGYPVDVPKLGTGLPRTRYCQDGPLKDFFYHHPIPDFIEPGFHDFIRKPQWENSWLIFNLITYAIWEEEVLKKPNLDKVPGTRIFEYRN